MKKFVKVILFILVATAAMAAGMYCLARYLDSDTPASSDQEAQKESGKKSSFSFPLKRRYTKLDLS